VFSVLSLVLNVDSDVTVEIGTAKMSRVNRASLGPLISTMLGYQNHHPSWLHQVHQLYTHLALILLVQRSS
jgi:hypothetical protein